MNFGMTSFGKMGVQDGGRRPVTPKVDPTTVCEAIEKRRYIEAIYQGQKIKAAPYALIRAQNGTLVFHAVIVDSPQGKLNHWAPQEYDLAQLTAQSISPDGFTPNTLFRSEDVVGEGEILCAVDRA